MAKSAIAISKLSILDIQEKEHAIHNPVEINTKKKMESSFVISLTPMFNLADDLIKIELGISVGLEQAGKKYPEVAKFNYDFLYSYADLKDLEEPDGEINAEIFLTCSNISYSTLRGIIHAKSSNTCIENILLPIVSGSELIAGMDEVETK